MNEIIKKIVDENIPCYFISPHQDDAIYSAGGLISYLSDKTAVTIINVFDGKGMYPYTLSAKAYIKQCSYKDSIKLTDQRFREEKLIEDKLKIKFKNFGYDLAVWRKKISNNKIINYLGNIFPEILHVYPIYRLNIKNGKIKKGDKEMINNIKIRLKNLVKNDAIVFCPFSIGGHVDHKIVKEVCSACFKNIIYWSDFPYNSQTKDLNQSKVSTDYTVFNFNENQFERYSLSKLYVSQRSSILREGRIRFTPERYYINTKLFSKYTNLDIDDNELIKLDTKKEITPESKNLWDSLWKEAENSTLYNSFEWFQICLKTFKPEKYVLHILYLNNKPFAILPLFLINKLGKKVWTNPGGHYSDKSSLLIKRYDLYLLEVLFKHLNATNEDIVLSESDQLFINSMKKGSYKILQSSISPYIPQSKHKDLYFSLKHRNKIEKILDENSKLLNIKLSNSNSEETLNIIKEIEKDSTRRESGKGSFNKKSGFSLYENIYKILNKNVSTYILYKNAHPIAYRIVVKHGKIYYDLNTAYKKDTEKYMPGKTLLYYFVKSVIYDISAIDMLRGDYEVKTEFTPFYENRYDIYFNKGFLKFNHLYYLDLIKNYIINNEILYGLYLRVKNVVNIT